MTESNGELQFVTPEEFGLAMNEKEILKVVQKIAGRPMRIKIALGTPAQAADASRKRRTTSPNARWRTPKSSGSRRRSRTPRSAQCVI